MRKKTKKKKKEKLASYLQADLIAVDGSGPRSDGEYRSHKNMHRSKCRRRNRRQSRTCREMTPSCRRPAGRLFAVNGDVMNTDTLLNMSGADLV